MHLILAAAVVVHPSRPSPTFPITQAERSAKGSLGLRLMATWFGGSRDKYRGGRSKCLRPMRPIRKTDWGRCGDLYQICLPRTGRCIIVPRIDAGPYWARCPADYEHPRVKVSKTGRKYVVKKRRSHHPRCWWTRHVDMTYPVMKALGHKGRERVRIRRVHRAPERCEIHTRRYYAQAGN